MIKKGRQPRMSKFKKAMRRTLHLDCNLTRVNIIFSQENSVILFFDDIFSEFKGMFDFHIDKMRSTGLMAEKELHWLRYVLH